MRSLMTVSLIAAFASLCVIPAKSAPLGATLLSADPLLSRLVLPATDLRTKALIINHKRLCAWRENNGTSFGKSGFCHWSDDAAIGSLCTCERTVEHEHQVHAGTVIEAPRGSGGSSPAH